jgi:hypothetical protein
MDIPLADQLWLLAVDNPSWYKRLVILAGSLTQSGQKMENGFIKVSPLFNSWSITPF